MIFYVGKQKYSDPRPQFIKNPDLALRCKTAYWQGIMLNRLDKVEINGIVRELRAQSLGHGVLEISLKPAAAKETNQSGE